MGLWERSPTTRVRGAALLGATALAASLVAGVGASPVAVGSVGAEAAAPCKVAGVHYKGKTSQAWALCLTLSRPGKAVLEFWFGFEYQARCTGLEASGRFGFVAPLAVAPDGTFQQRSGATANVQLSWTGTELFVAARPASTTKAGRAEIVGRVRGAKASGTVRLTLKLGGIIDTKTGRERVASCDTGVLRWSAKRVA